MIKSLKESPQSEEFTVNLTDYADGWTVSDYAVAFISLEDEYKSKGYANSKIKKFYISNGGKLYAVISCSNGTYTYSVLCNIIDKKGNTKPFYVKIEAESVDEVYEIYDKEYMGNWVNKNLGYKFGDIISVD